MLEEKERPSASTRSEKSEDLIKAGVIDPTKVARTALENAASVAGLRLTTETTIANKPEKKKAAAAGGHDHDHGGGGFGDELDF